MKNTDFSPEVYFRELYENRPFPFEGKAADEIKITAEEIREKAIRAFGIDNIPEKTESLSPVLLKSEKRKGRIPDGILPYDVQKYRIKPLPCQRP